MKAKEEMDKIKVDKMLKNRDGSEGRKWHQILKAQKQWSINSVLERAYFKADVV